MTTQVRPITAVVTCPWCAAPVTATRVPGEDEPVFARHPLPGHPALDRRRGAGPLAVPLCPASGLTPGEVEPAPGTR